MFYYFFILCSIIFPTKPSITVYYDAYYKQEWFKGFENYQLNFVKISTPYNLYATNIISNKKHTPYTIYLINNDIYYKRYKILNYKIKGLSYINQQVSIVTVKNMTNKNINKVILHEFSHGIGLPHCTHKNCIMNDAKGKFVNLVKCNTFKESCKKYILANSVLQISND